MIGRLKVQPVLFATVMVLMTSAGALGQEHEWGSRTTYPDGRSFRFTITDAEMKTLPAWNPETEEAPLSSRQAVAAARAVLPRLVTLPEKWELDRIELTKIAKDKWLYKLQFFCGSEACGDFFPSYMVYVKMDGTIVEPVPALSDEK